MIFGIPIDPIEMKPGFLSTQKRIIADINHLPIIYKFLHELFWISSHFLFLKGNDLKR